MTSSSPKPDNSDGPIVWPSLGFYFGALKRQGLLASLICIPVLILVAIGATKLPYEYTSEISVVYDTLTPETMFDSVHPNSIANRISGVFLSSFTDPDYLQKVLDKLPPDEKAEKKGRGLVKTLKSYLGLEKATEDSLKTLEQEERVAKQEALAKTLKGVTSLTTSTLTITAVDKTPQRAQEKARAAMEQVIINELQIRLKAVLERLREQAATEATYLKEKEEFPEVGSTYQDRSTKDEVSPERQRELKGKEQRIVKDLLVMRTDLERARATYDTNLQTLENQLNNLLSRKGIDHPEVGQKNREIEKLRAAPTWIPIERDLNLLRTRLSEVQREMVGLGLTIDRSAQIAFFPAEIQLTLGALSNQIRRLEVLAENLQAGIKDPWSSRHLTLVREASLNITPSNKKQFLVAAGVGFALVILIFLLIVVCREFFQPYVVATEQIRNRYQMPEDRFVEVNRRWLKKTPPFDLERIRQLKPQLSTLPSKGSPELRLLDAFRHLGQLIESMPKHQVISVFDTGSKPNSNNVALNLAQVMAADTGRRVLFLSFRSGSKSPANSPGDLMDFLSGKSEWKDVRLKGAGDSSLDQAYAQDPAKTLSNFQEATLIRLFKILREKYALIVIDALPPIYNNENGILHKLSDTAAIQVRLNESRDADIARLLQFLDRDKIAAFLVSE